MTDDEDDPPFDNLTAESNKQLVDLQDELIMLLATELGYDVGELVAEYIDEYGDGWTLLENSLWREAQPITNPRILAVLKEYDALLAPLNEVIPSSTKRPKEGG
jgi:hypothetical protein